MRNIKISTVQKWIKDGRVECNTDLKIGHVEIRWITRNKVEHINVTGKKPEGVYDNGDLFYGGHPEDEDGDGKLWYPAYHPGSDPDNSPDYVTEEIPETFPINSAPLIIFPNGTPESEAQQYFLQKQIGDSRFGSECRHGRAKKGYCPDCLRKVI